MPSFDVIIGPDSLTIYAPVFGGGGGGGGDRAGNPRLTDILNKLLEGIRGGFQSQPMERRVDLLCWKEGQGHQWFYVPIGTVISGVSCCQSKILYLK